MWIVMRYKHKKVGELQAPIVESFAFGPFDERDAAEQWALRHYGGDYSCSMHDVRSPEDPLPTGNPK